MCGRPTHFGPKDAAQFGPNLSVLLGLPISRVNRRAVHAKMGRGDHRRRLLAPPSSVPVARRGLAGSQHAGGWSRFAWRSD